MQEELRKAEAEIEILKTCRDHWKNSYYSIYKIIGTILEFHDRWKGVTSNEYQTIRTKRNREAWKLIKEITNNRNNRAQGRVVVNRTPPKMWTPPEFINGDVEK